MKKLLACLAALMLALTACALAEVTVDHVTELSGSVSLCKATNCYVAYTGEGYCLFDAEGNALSATYRSMSVKQSGYYLEVQNVAAAEDLNCLGLVDAAGREILPLVYGDIDIIEPDWVLAYVLGPAEGDVGEYKDSSGNQYIVTRTDVVYKGQIIGSLSREDFNKSYSVYPRGAFLYVKLAADHVYWLDGSFNRVDVTGDAVSISEYTSIYKQGVLHNPTQQYAFTPGCTLTGDQVEQHVWYDSTEGVILDLQGNVLASGLAYDYAYFRQDAFVVKKDGLSGVIDLAGNVIVPLAYKEIASPSNGGLFDWGYVAAMDAQGRLFYYSESGEISASVAYEMTSSSDYKGFTYGSPIVAVKNLGKYMLISATHGELPGSYDDVSINAARPIAVVKQGEYWGCVDMAGNVVVPFELRYAPTVSADSTLVCGTNQDRTDVIYHLNLSAAPAQEAAAVPGNWTETVISGSDADSAPVLAEGAWACTCGTINTGKFCAECGARKPEPTSTPTPEPTPTPAADDGTWACDCGSVNTGKFCPECGAARPVVAPAEPQCSNCGYKPEGDAPKFCPECGTKF